MDLNYDEISHYHNQWLSYLMKDANFIINVLKEIIIKLLLY